MNCVKEVLWVALGTPLRGVAVRIVTLSPGVGNNRWNQLLWESVWLSGGAVYRRLAARLRPDTGLRQLSHSLSQRGPAELQTGVCSAACRERSAFITRSPLLQGLHMTLWVQWSLSTASAWWIWWKYIWKRCRFCIGNILGQRFKAQGATSCFKLRSDLFYIHYGKKKNAMPSFFTCLKDTMCMNNEKTLIKVQWSIFPLLK